MTNAEQIASKLTEAQRKAWIHTVLNVAASEPQRRAFIAGYNGQVCPAPATAGKRSAWHDGNTARNFILESQTNDKR